jgi:superfamily II DNA or RNA helicase
MPVKLRDHQVEAVDAIVRGLDIPPGKKIPPNGLRAQVHSPCGSGKTITAAAASLRLAPHGRVLVMVPTLDLLTPAAADRPQSSTPLLGGETDLPVMAPQLTARLSATERQTQRAARWTVALKARERRPGWAKPIA